MEILDNKEEFQDAESDEEVGSVPREEHILLQWSDCDGAAGGHLLRHPLPGHRDLGPLLRV